MNDSYIINDLYCQDLNFTVPLDYQDTNAGSLTIYVREVASKAGVENQLPYLVYFQGGPGFAAGRPTGLDGWIKAASQYYRILLLDQRGTGNSSAVSAQTLRHFASPQAQADYLSHFRADNIVRDAELIRQAHIGEQKWSILGQSFGGFCVLRYLSSAPHGLNQAFITGGLPSLTRPATDVYKATYGRVESKNKQFYAQFPKAQHYATLIADHLKSHHEVLPNGQQLTVEHFQLLGINLGVTGGHEALYYLLEQAFVEVDSAQELSHVFKHQLMSMLDYDTNPFFAILHESIYCQNFASQWSADSVRHDQAIQFNYVTGNDFYFTGEMVYPWMFEQFANLIPLQQAATILSEKEDWPLLYDLQQLKDNKVPVAAAIYFNDMYVDINYSLETVAQINNIKTWVSSDYEHNGIRVDGELIFNKLHKLINH